MQAGSNHTKWMPEVVGSLCGGSVVGSWVLWMVVMDPSVHEGEG